MLADQSASTFYFRAVTPEGSIYTGSVRAGTLEAALRHLTDKGFQPLRAGETPVRGSWLNTEIALGGPSGLGLAEAELVCRELGLLLAASVPLADTLAIAAKSMPRRSAAGRFLALTRHGVRLGQPLSVAMESTNLRPPAGLISIVRAGEHANALPRCLAILGETYRESLRFSKALVSALAYPMLLAVFSVLVFGLIAFFVAPSLATLFTSMGKPVPPVISVLSAMAAFLGTHLIPIGLLLALLGGALLAGLGRVAGQGARRVAIRLPWIGTAMKWAATRHFASTLHLYIASGLPIATALPNALSASRLPVPKRGLDSVSDAVRRGVSLATALRDFGLFPDKFVHMVEIGESSGRIADILLSAVDEAKTKVEQRLALISSLLAPILILVVGSLIGAVIFSVFSSLLQINELVA